MKAGDAVVDILKDWNIDHVYGYPGDSVNNLVEALRKAKDQIKFIQVRHEETASLAAAAEAKITGRVGVCLSIGGPGAIHLLNGMYDAKEDAAPLVVITGQVSHQLLGTNNFQEVNLERMFDDVAIFNRRVTSGEQIQPLLKQAFKEAYEQKGVAVLNVPDNIFKETVNKVELRSSKVAEYHLFPNKESVKQAVSLIQRSKKACNFSWKRSDGCTRGINRVRKENCSPGCCFTKRKRSDTRSTSIESRKFGTDRDKTCI